MGYRRRTWPSRLATAIHLLAVLALAAGCDLPLPSEPGLVASPSPTGIGPAPTSGGAEPSTASPASAEAGPIGSFDPPNPPAISPAEVVLAVDRLIAEAPAHVAIVIEEPEGRVFYQHGRDTLFEAASLYKLGIMVELYRQRELGLLRFNDEIYLSAGFFAEEDEVYSPDLDIGASIEVGVLLRQMITLSSNVAATALLAAVGTERVNATLRDLGLTETEIRWSPQASQPVLDDAEAVASTSRSRTRLAPASDGRNVAPRLEDATNVTTPADMALLFRSLLLGKVISPAASAEMIALLADQQINDRLPADLPLETMVAHKTGNLDAIVHDAGIVFAPRGPVIVVVMSDEVENEDAVVRLCREVGRIAYGVMS